MAKVFYNPPFIVQVSTSGAYIDREFDFDSRVKRIVSMQVIADFPDKAYFRGTQGIEINGDQIMPEEVDTKILMSNSGVDPNPRFLDLGDVKPGNLKCRIKYRDSEHPTAAFAPYKVKYLFKCEI